jgi:hypothetical protein
MKNKYKKIYNILGIIILIISLIILIFNFISDSSIGIVPCHYNNNLIINYIYIFSLINLFLSITILIFNKNIIKLILIIFIFFSLFFWYSSYKDIISKVERLDNECMKNYQPPVLPR